MYMYMYIMYAVQDDLLVSVIFGKFACGKLIGKFYIGYVPLSMLRLKQNGKFYIGNFFIHVELPITDINSSPINHLVRYVNKIYVLLKNHKTTVLV